MVKVRKTDRKISPFGGLNFVIDEIEGAGIPALIDKALPKRHGGSKYSYADVLLSLIYGVFCGADRLEDMTNLKNTMHNSSLNIPSPDSMSIVFRRKLVTVNEKAGNHAVNINMPLNGLLLDIALKLGELKAGKKYVLDFDNTCIPCEKEDAEWTYKKFRGYQPGVCFIGQTPVYIEGMNGNNPARPDQASTLKRALELMDGKGVGIRRFRADAASYLKDVIDLVSGRGIEFFIRAENNSDLLDFVKYQQTENWKKVVLANDSFEACSFEYAPFNDRNHHKKNQPTYRIVTARRPSEDVKPHSVTGEPYIYRSIITNNHEMCDADVIWTYNQRGDIERNFDILNNDWNWSHLPFSYMAENTAFMLVTAMGMIMYNYLVKLFASRVDFVEPTFRMKAFRFNVVAVSAEWRGDTLLIYDKSKPWEKLAG